MADAGSIGPLYLLINWQLRQLHLQRLNILCCPIPCVAAEVIDRAVAAGSIDIGVHSLKDTPIKLPDGVDLAACLPRDDPRYAAAGFGSRQLTLVACPPVLGSVRAA